MSGEFKQLGVMEGSIPALQRGNCLGIAETLYKAFSESIGKQPYLIHRRSSVEARGQDADAFSPSIADSHNASSIATTGALTKALHPSTWERA